MEQRERDSKDIRAGALQGISSQAAGLLMSAMLALPIAAIVKWFDPRTWHSPDWLVVILGTALVLCLIAVSATWLAERYGFKRPFGPAAGGRLQSSHGVVEQETDEKLLQLVTGRHFQNCDVILDGKAYYENTMSNVTLVYNGGPYVFKRNNIGSLRIRSDRPDIEKFVDLLNAFGFLSVPIVGQDGKVITPSNRLHSKAQDEPAKDPPA